MAWSIPRWWDLEKGPRWGKGPGIARASANMTTFAAFLTWSATVLEAWDQKASRVARIVRALKASSSMSPLTKYVLALAFRALEGCADVIPRTSSSEADLVLVLG